MTLDARVSDILSRGGVPHALIGAAALAAAGIARSTLDIDFLVLDPRVLDREFWHGAGAAGVAIEIRRGDADDPLAGVVRLVSPGERPVDLVVGRHRWQQRAIDRARRLPSGAAVVLPRDLVLLKLFAGGTQDRWDVRQLLDSNSEPDLREHVEEDLSDLPAPAAAIWAQILAAP